MSGFQPVSPEAVRGQVSAPALALIVIGAVGLLTTCCCGFPWSVNPFLQDLEVVPVDWSEGMYRSGPMRSGSLVQAGGGSCANVLGLLCNILMVYGGMQMRAVKSFGIARSAAIAAVIPVQCCFLVSVPIGIWALLVLNRPEVKAGFPPD